MKRSQNFPACYSKLCFTCPENYFEGKRGFEKNCYNFSTSSGQIESIRGNFFDKRLKQQSTCQDKHFEELYISHEKPFLQNIFGKWTAICWLLRKTLRHDRQNCALHLQMIFLKRVCNLFCSKLFLFCGISDEKFQIFRENFSRCVKAAIYLFTEPFWKKYVFFKRKSVFPFSDIAENFGPSGEHPSKRLLKLNPTCPEHWTKWVFL